MHWQPHDFGLPVQVKTFDLFNEFFNKNNYKHSDVLSIDMMKKIRSEAKYMLLHKSCTSDGKCLVLKKKN